VLPQQLLILAIGVLTALIRGMSPTRIILAIRYWD